MGLENFFTERGLNLKKKQADLKENWELLLTKVVKLRVVQIRLLIFVIVTLWD